MQDFSQIGSCRRRACRRSLVLGGEAAVLRCAVPECGAPGALRLPLGVRPDSAIAAMCRDGLKLCQFPIVPVPAAPLFFRLPKEVTLAAICDELRSGVHIATARTAEWCRADVALTRPGGVPHYLWDAGIEFLRRGDFAMVISAYGEWVLPQVDAELVRVELDTRQSALVAQRLGEVRRVFPRMRGPHFEAAHLLPYSLHRIGIHFADDALTFITPATRSALCPVSAVTQLVVERIDEQFFRWYVVPPSSFAGLGTERAIIMAYGLLRLLHAPARANPRDAG